VARSITTRGYGWRSLHDFVSLWRERILALSPRVSVEGLLIVWFATTPLASVYVRVPADRALITYDRAFFAMLALVSIWKWRQAHRRVADETGRSSSLAFCPPGALQAFSRAMKFHLAWALLSTLAIVSVVLVSDNVGYALRLAVDSFWLPLVAFYLVRKHFDIAGRARAVMLAAVAIALFLFATGAFELATRADVFPFKGSDLIREGELRVNGPFASDSSYAIICGLVFLFLRAAPRLLKLRLDSSARLVWWIAMAASLAGSVLSLFRAVAVAVVVGWVIVELLNRSGNRDAPRSLTRSRRLRIVGLMAVAAALLVALALLSPFLGSRLTSGHSVYGRLATWKAALKMTLDRPVTGVGLANYTDYFREKYSPEGEVQESVQDTRAAAAPHNNLLWVAAELGLAGLALYAFAHFQIAMMGYRLLRRAGSPGRRMAAACYIALFIAYWIPGLTLTSGAYSDLNLYLFFMLGLLLNVGGERTATCVR